MPPELVDRQCWQDGSFGNQRGYGSDRDRQGGYDQSGGYGSRGGSYNDEYRSGQASGRGSQQEWNRSGGSWRSAAA